MIEITVAYAFFTGGSTVLLGLAVFKLLTDETPSATARWFAVFLFCAICFLNFQLVYQKWPLLAIVLEPPLFFLPGAFWLFAHTLCREWEPFPTWGWGLIFLNMFTNLIALHVMQSQQGEIARYGQIAFVAAQPVKLALISCALSPLLRAMNADLVEPRRRLRMVLLTVLGVYMLLVILFEVTFVFLPPIAGIGTVQAASAMLLSALVCAWLMGFTSQSLAPPLTSATAQPPTPKKTNNPLLNSLSQQIDQGVYRDPGLTVSRLAELLDTQEYRLRRVINGQLGFRNFNEYINTFRLQDAIDQLSDASCLDKSILAIAMDAGFGSLSAFNSTFKRRRKETPSQYRAGVALRKT